MLLKIVELMKVKEFEKQMKSFMVDDIVLAPDTWTVIHVDGDNFSEYTKKYDKPFDELLKRMFEHLTKHLMKSFNARYAYSQFDEVNLLLGPENDLHGRRLGKIISKAVSLASSRFTYTSNGEAGFAAHVYSLPTIEQVEDYFRWRLADGEKNCLNTYVYWMMREDGLSPGSCAKRMHKMNREWKREFLSERGRGVDGIPSWQRLGFEMVWEEYEKEGFNPITKEKTIVTRRRLVEQEPTGRGLLDALKPEIESTIGWLTRRLPKDN